MGGDQRLARALIDGLHGALVGTETIQSARSRLVNAA
jgi:uncharacterized membrane protein